jgi:hypothetical protein
MIDPEMTRAKSALERLSADPAARELAGERELAAWNYEHTLRLARREGVEAGIEKGIARGQNELLLKRLRLRFGRLSESAVRRVGEANQEEIELWVERVLSATAVEDVLRG